MEQENRKNQKSKALGIIFKILLFASIVFSVYPTTDKMYNLLPFYDFSGISTDGVDFSLYYSLMQWMLPIVLALIYFGLYHAYIKLIIRNINTSLRIFNIQLHKSSINYSMDICFIVLCIYLGIIGIIMSYFPLVSNILYTPLKVLGAVALFCYVYFKLIKGLESTIKPFIIRAFMVPAILLVVFI